MNNKVLKNASWIICCKATQSILSFIIGIITARYLGPSNFGLISYAASIVAFFLPIMQLGFSSILVQEILTNPENEGEILGTSLVLNNISAIVSVIGATTFTFFSNSGKTVLVVCFLYSLVLIFQAGEMIQYWFQAKLLSKYPSIFSLIAYAIVSTYKIYILISAKDVRWFACTHIIEAAIIALLLFFTYKKMGGDKLIFSVSTGKKMLTKSKYYIFAGLMAVILKQVDRIMLNFMLSQEVVGFYSAAFTCVGITAFVFSAIIDSMRPFVLYGKKISDEVFEKRIITLFTMVSILTLLQGVLMTAFAPFIVSVMFGQAYTPTIRILQILVWSIVFSHNGIVCHIWILAEGKQRYLLWINLIGMLISVAGNVVAIHLFGAIGSAVITILTNLVMNFVIFFIFKDIRRLGYLMIKSLNPQNIGMLIKYIKRSFKI